MQTKEKRLENLAEVGPSARKEAEDFLNRWLNDSTKGWAMRTDLTELDMSGVKVDLGLIIRF